MAPQRDWIAGIRRSCVVVSPDQGELWTWSSDEGATIILSLPARGVGNTHISSITKSVLCRRDASRYLSLPFSDLSPDRFMFLVAYRCVESLSILSLTTLCQPHLCGELLVFGIYGNAPNMRLWLSIRVSESVQPCGVRPVPVLYAQLSSGRRLKGPALAWVKLL